MSSVPRPRWFQFSLRTLLVVVTLICVGPGGYLAYEQRLARREDEAATTLRMVAGNELYTRPQWLRTLLARRSAGHVVGVGLRSRETQDADLAPLGEFSQLVWLHLADTKVTDQGLVHLTGLTKLESLRLTDVGVKELQAALPELEIIR